MAVVGFVHAAFVVGNNCDYINRVISKVTVDNHSIMFIEMEVNLLGLRWLGKYLIKTIIEPIFSHLQIY